MLNQNQLQKTAAFHNTITPTAEVRAIQLNLRGSAWIANSRQFLTRERGIVVRFTPELRAEQAAVPQNQNSASPRPGGI